MKSYQSIPPVSNDEDPPREKQLKNIPTYAKFGILVAGALMLYGLLSDNSAETVIRNNVEQWPDFLVSRFDTFDKRPINTDEAIEMGWQKIDNQCEPSLGEPWLYGGVHSAKYSATLYFTPQAGNIPGSISGIEVDVYGQIDETLIGSYFSEKRVAADGPYYSLAVGLRNSDKEDLCSIEATLKPPIEKHIAIAPSMANTLIPNSKYSPELFENWQEGSCVPRMGVHWIRDIAGGRELSYKYGDTVPVVPMYDPTDGELIAFFFLAPEGLQNWQPDKGCKLLQPTGYTSECLSVMNFWDVGPGLHQANIPPLYICSNLCGDCQFTGSFDGKFTTMHWFLRDTKNLTCHPGPFPGAPSYCASGEYPQME